jgi:hypothetical protein
MGLVGLSVQENSLTLSLQPYSGSVPYPSQSLHSLRLSLQSVKLQMQIYAFYLMKQMIQYYSQNLLFHCLQQLLMPYFLHDLQLLQY